MKSQFDQDLLSSFYLWFENRLLKDDTKAYITGLENKFKYVEYADLPSTLAGYQGEFRQLVAEHSVDVPNSGFFVNGNFVTGDSSANGGIYTDYENGRILFPVASGASLTVTANSTVKEVNIYTTNDDDVELLLHSEFKEQGQTKPWKYRKGSKLDEKAYFLPACFVSLASSDNTEFCFGGEEETMNRIKVMVLTEDNFIMDSVLSRFRDTVREYVTHIPYSSFPYGYKNSIKSFPYEYDTLKEEQGSGATKSRIQSVNVSRVVSPALKDKINKNFKIAFIEFDLSTYRFPRL